MKKYLICCIVLALISCKQETPIDELPLIITKRPVNKVEVVVNMVVEENDVFELFYTEDGTGNFGAKSVRINVNGFPAPQELVFKLPDNALPKNIRIDVGQNPDQEDMVIQSMIIKYHNKTLKLSQNAFVSSFIPNEHIEISQEKGIIKPVTVAGYDPAFFPQPKLTQALTKMVASGKG